MLKAQSSSSAAAAPMLVPTVSSNKPAATSLSHDEIELTSKVVLRLCDELTRFVATMPKTGRTALALARELKIDRNTCQRALSALSVTGDPLQAMLRLPGPKGLRQLLDAAPKSGVRGVRRQPFAAAIDQFEKLIWDLGPSQSKLLARIRSTLTPDASSFVAVEPVDEPRHGHFLASAALTGVEMETHITIGAIRRMPSNPFRFEQFGVTGWIGLKARDRTVPLTVGAATLRDRMGDINQQVRVTPLGTLLTENDGLIEPFSSKPYPKVTSRSQAGVAVQFVDLPGPDISDSSDIILARHRANISDPRADEDPIWSQIARIKYPARRMVLDLFIERAIAIGTPWSASYFWHPTLSGHAQRHWHERLPGSPRVSVLGVGTGTAESSLYPRHKALLAHMFTVAGWREDEFIGYRCEIEYPIWGATYFLSFAFETAQGSTPGSSKPQ